MYKLFFVLLLSFLLQGCLEKNGNVIEEISIDLKNAAQVSSDAAFDAFDYVKLEMTPESMLSDIGKVLVNKDRIYVLPKLDARVFIFSREGKFVNCLKRGQGPGEVMFVSDMDIVDDVLYILDNYRNVRKYDADGKFMENIHSLGDDYSFSMKYQNDTWLFFDPNVNKRSNHMLHIMSDDGNMTNYFPKEENQKLNSFLHYNFCSGGYISWPLCDTIYQYINQSSVLPKYWVRFSNNDFFDMQKDRKYTADELCKLNQNKSYYRWLKDVVPYDKGLFLSFNYDKSYFVRYENGKTVIYDRLLDGFPEMKNSSVGNCNGSLIYVYAPEALLESRTNGDLVDKTGKLQEICQTLSEDDNPILFFFNLSAN